MVPFINHMLKSPGMFAMHYYEKRFSLAELQEQLEAKSTKTCTQLCQQQAAKYKHYNVNIKVMHTSEVHKELQSYTTEEKDTYGLSSQKIRN